jgi:hypothetical protein
VPVRLDAGRHKGVTGVQMARIRPVLAPVTESGALHVGSSGKVGRAAGLNHGGSEQSGNMGRGKGHLNGDPRILTASRGNAHGNITGICTHSTARRRGDAAEGFLSVVALTHGT